MAQVDHESLAPELGQSLHSCWKPSTIYTSSIGAARGACGRSLPRPPRPHNTPQRGPAPRGSKSPRHGRRPSTETGSTSCWKRGIGLARAARGLGLRLVVEAVWDAFTQRSGVVPRPPIRSPRGGERGRPAWRGRRVGQAGGGPTLCGGLPCSSVRGGRRPTCWLGWRCGGVLAGAGRAGARCAARSS